MSEYARKAWTGDGTGPLSDLKVLDLSRLVAGNMLSLQFADFGADVIKIEPPAGDPLRAWTEEGVSHFWHTYARNKRSIMLNLRRQEDKAALWALVREADVLIENYRPGTLEKMGFAPADLLAANPGLIIVRISGFGQTGPYADLPGFGTLVEALSGFADRNGFADREPVLPPLALADMIAGLYGASATMMALHARPNRNEGGQVIDLSLLEPIFSVLGPEAAIFGATGKVKQRTGSASNTSCPRNVYRCGDGRYIALSASTQIMAVRVFEAIGRPELISDARYADNASRIRHRDEVDGMLADWFSQRDRDEALDAMRAADVTVAPVYDISDIARDSHFNEREVVVSLPGNEGSEVITHNVVPRLSQTPGGFRRPSAHLGEHTREVLTEAGLDESLIDRIAGTGK